MIFRPATLSEALKALLWRGVVAALLGAIVYSWYARSGSGQREAAYYAAFAWIVLALWWLAALLRLIGIALRRMVDAANSGHGGRESDPEQSP